MSKIPKHLFVGYLFLICPTQIQAGLLVAPSVHWSAFSFRPVDQEETPNFFAYGGGLNLGYSFAQVFDLALFGRYHPGNYGAATLGEEDAKLASYGLELAVRIKRSVYIALRGGLGTFHLYRHHDHVPQFWEGFFGGFSLGGIIKVNRMKFWQISFDVAGYQEEPVVAEGQARQISQFSVTVAFVYNGFHNTAIEDTIFSSFLDTLF